MGPYTIENYNFGAVSDTGGFGISYWVAKFDGILGLGFSSITQGGGAAPFPALVESGQLDEPVFAFYLVNDDKDKGELVFGGVDEDHYTGEFNTIPLTVQTYWQIELQGVAIGEDKLEASKKVIIDSGTSLIAGPKHLVRKIAQAAGAKSVMGGVEFIFDSCDTADNGPDITFKLGGKDYVLTSEDYVIRTESGGQTACLLGFSGMDMFGANHGLWILGDVFMRKYYVKFDYGDKSVGIALAKKGKNSLITSPTQLLNSIYNEDVKESNRKFRPLDFIVLLLGIYGLATLVLKLAKFTLRKISPKSSDQDSFTVESDYNLEQGSKPLMY